MHKRVLIVVRLGWRKKEREERERERERERVRGCRVYVGCASRTTGFKEELWKYLGCDMNEPGIRPHALCIAG